MDTEDIFEYGRSPYFDEYCTRIRNGTATDMEHKEFYMILMQRFCINVYDEKPVEPWILVAFANAFTKILAGGDWNDEITLPWIPMTPLRKQADERNLHIYCEIQNIINKTLKHNSLEKPKITKLIEDSADKHNCSYEIAREAYYKYKKKLS
ncbi:hypothetical protein [Methylobacter sp. S3L5C]|uniref:hypothetical protein n=1 Tax=Methylobacter sp. S3L5C TaxID=2839024 RepID=UPI001FACE42F|nr:hypothetical protein [Methylobacter sp. S3L5C]UOA08577.1 hypothetical protein KKZ03_20690 [Methylobacter sp. S3L5C]